MQAGVMQLDTYPELKTILEKMWQDYCQLNPEALRVYNLFADPTTIDYNQTTKPNYRPEIVINDHIAYRTINHPRLGIESLAKHFKKWGYKAIKDYTFVEKKLYAQHFEHENPNLPKIFISELELEKVSSFVRSQMEEITSWMSDTLVQKSDLLVAGRLWPMSFATYQKLYSESEYAAWLAAFGFRPNHFTVSVNHLKNWQELKDLNEFLKSQKVILNSSGGEIKGSPSDYLEQSSTMAAEIPVLFQDGTFSIPGCYYEFAKRHALPDGKIYQGFVAASADKIFESTNKIK